jgi:hypothetical protein
MQAGPSIFIHPLGHVSYRGFRNFADLYPAPGPVNTQKRRLVGSHISTYNSGNSARRSCKYSHPQNKLFPITRSPKVPRHLSCSVGDTDIPPMYVGPKHHLPFSLRKVIHHRLVFSPASTGSVALHYLSPPHSVLDTSESSNNEIYYS